MEGRNVFGPLNKEKSQMKFAGKTVHVDALTKGMGALLVLSLVLARCSKSLPDDGKDAKMMLFTNLNYYRYCEL
jgi:hypothetical protein